MPKAEKRRLSNDDLVDLLGKELEKFTDEYYPPHGRKLQALKRCTDLVNINSEEIGVNAPRRRAKEILTDLWTNVPHVFLLSSFAITPSLLGTIVSTDYMKPVLRWWNGIEDVPRGLAMCMDRHSDALPTASRDQRQVIIETRFGAVLDFLQQEFGDQTATMIFPFTSTPAPSVRLKQGIKIELPPHIAASFTQYYQSTY